MEVTREDVLRCAELAHLSLTEEEIEPMRRAMEDLLTHASSLNELNLEGVEPWPTGQESRLPRREDEAREGFTQEEALQNAPEADRGLFLVPKAL
jgi:aspartyl-tRNA(Asn)/glutamyl-tRNA(Gln) amidotransferase subunit C